MQKSVLTMMLLKINRSSSHSLLSFLGWQKTVLNLW